VKFLKAAVLFSSLITSANSFACSAPPPSNVEESFKDSKAVYLVVAKSIKVISAHEDKPSWIDREVVFEVLQSWKGGKTRGERLTYKTKLSSSCGLSVDNYNHWLENPEGKTLEERFPKFSGIWLVYEYDENQFSLSGSGRTRPLEFGGVLDLEELYKLSGKAEVN